jgi:triosephosphate isomerase
MNKTNKEASIFIEGLSENKEAFSDIEVVICPSFVALEKLKGMIVESGILLGAQNVYQEEQGAFTGEVSCLMIEPFCSYVILGHSERRKYFNESNIDIRLKAILALNYNIKPIICVGESLEDRGNNLAAQVVKNQLEESLKSIAKEQVQNIVIAYEPVWAIGTGMSDNPEESNLICNEIRQVLSELFGKELSEQVRVLYGGSANPENVQSFIEMPDIDGFLIGGASLDLTKFLKIIEITKVNYNKDV